MTLVFELIKTNGRRILRNRGLVFATVFFPLIFIGVFGIAFQNGQITTSPVEIAVIAMDEGIPVDAVMFNHSGSEASGTELQDTYLDILENLTYEDNVTHLFDMKFYSMTTEDDAKKLVEQGDLAGILYIPQDFSFGLMATFRAQYQNNINITFATNQWTAYPEMDHITEIDLIGDQSLQGFGIASSVISTVTSLYFNFDDTPKNYQLEVDGSIDTEEFTTFDFILPGLVVFGLMQTLGIVASTALNDVESGLLNRMKITSMKPVEYVAALIITQLLVSMVQIPIFFGVGVLFGFPISEQIVLAFIFAVLISLSMTGIGLIIASVVDQVDSANTIAAMISTPMAFLAGAFFVVPNPVLVENFVNGNSLGIMDLLPPTTAIQGLRLILIGGRSLAEVSYQLGMLSGLTIILLVTGLILYSRKHFVAKH